MGAWYSHFHTFREDICTGGHRGNNYLIVSHDADLEYIQHLHIHIVAGGQGVASWCSSKRI